jgi:hypothetical protein
MNEPNINQNKLSAILHSIEEDFAYFKFLHDMENDEPNFKWPIEKLHEGMQIGDTVEISLNFEQAEQRKSELKKKQANDEKLDEMRKLLVELVN